MVAARSAFENIDTEAEEVAETLGAARWQIFFRLTLPSAGRGLMHSLAIAWVRVIGEFGIVMVFCYFPQGIPVKLFVNLQNQGVNAVYPLLLILLMTTLPLPLWCFTKLRSEKKCTAQPR